MKKLILLCFLLMISFTFYGCNNSGRGGSRSGADFFKNLKSYEAKTTITFLKDKQPNEIKMKQTVQEDGSYELLILEPAHLCNVTLKFDGSQVVEYHPLFEQTIESKETKAQSEILLTSFSKRFLTQDNIKKEEVALNGKKTTTYEMPIEGDYKYLSKEKIWLDETYKPVQLVIYDCEGNESIVIVYEDFKYNS